MSNIDSSSVIDGQLDGVNPHLITIGKHCTVGSRAALLTHCPIRGARPVVLEDYVWIGYGAIVLPGVTIGRCSIVGAGSVVTHDIPPCSIAAGVPARVLRELAEHEIHELVQNQRAGRPMGKDPNV